MNFMLAGSRRLALGLAVSLSALLASCGGGTQVEKFVPSRVLALGDENSAFEATPGAGATDNNRRKYTVNGYVTGTSKLDCTMSRLWIQHLAGAYGLVFPQCNPADAATSSRIAAAAGAKVADIGAQIDALGGLSSLGDKDLVTVYVGTHDIVEQYVQVRDHGLSMSDAVAMTRARGDALAANVNEILATGARVLLLAVPDVGRTPYGVQDDLVRAGSASQLNELTKGFNDRLGFSILQDGHLVALLKANDLLRTLQAGVNFNGLSNVYDPVCDTTKYDVLDLTTCDVNTMIPAVTIDTVGAWLWADKLHFSPAGHAFLGSAAIAQVARNPF